jgi:hypothetical protein
VREDDADEEDDPVRVGNDGGIDGGSDRGNDGGNDGYMYYCRLHVLL